MDNSTYERKYATERIQLPKEWPKNLQGNERAKILRE